MTLNMHWIELLAASSTSYLLIFAAEIGDKSQIVCMTLAARYRAWPVMTGSVIAFLLLNTLAVVFGMAIADAVPTVYISSIVAVMFALFGVHALRIEEDGEVDAVSIGNRGIIFATFLLITVAEFGDKTQLAVVALSSSSIPTAVWLGATLALITTSALGVWAGRTLLQKMPIILLHRISGIFFILLAVYAAYKTVVTF